jgi:hypothetical protein
VEFEHRSVLWVLALAIILWLPAAFWMGRSLLIHNFGLLGG